MSAIVRHSETSYSVQGTCSGIKKLSRVLCTVEMFEESAVQLSNFFRCRYVNYSKGFIMTITYYEFNCYDKIQIIGLFVLFFIYLFIYFLVLLCS